MLLVKTSLNLPLLTMGHSTYGGMNRHYSWYLPSLHALKDWWDKSDITWFLRGKQVKEIANARNQGWVCLSWTTGNDNLVILKRIMSKYGWEWSLLLFCMQKSGGRCPHGKQWIWRKSCKNSICTFCMTMKSLSCFVRINKLNRNYSYCQILSLVCPLKYHTTLPLSHGL